MSKSQTVYRELQRHLDKLPVGFPQTESGVEIRILSLLFSPKEAIVATKLKTIPETIRTIFRRVKKEVDSKEELRVLLNNLVEKGAIFGKKKGKEFTMEMRCLSLECMNFKFYGSRVNLWN